MTNYRHWMDEACEPANPRKYGRYHNLLEETVYPINEEYVEWAAYQTVVRNRQISSIVDGEGLTPDYHWWVYFDTFNPFDFLDMGR